MIAALIGGTGLSGGFLVRQLLADPDVLAIQVYASPVRPHYLRREGLDRGGVTPICTLYG